MKEIEGKYSKAKVFTNEIEQTAEAQIKELCDQEFTKNSHIRIMPDVHAGAGCTIGTSMKINDKIVPNLVGVDIGCGMETVVLEAQDLDFAEVDRVINSEIPSGFNVHSEPKGKALYWMILTLENFIENEPDERVDLEDCKQMLEKLKAWKRLKDKGFRFDPVDRYESLCGNGFVIPMQATMPPEAYTDVEVSKDLDLLFGGEE